MLSTEKARLRVLALALVWVVSGCGTGPDPSAECNDADNDGYGGGAACAGTDCTEADPTCWEGACCDTVMCADTDGDGRGEGPDCTGMDCTEADPTCWEGACCDAVMCADTDGDGRGEGPDCAGADCTEADPTCWEGACCEVATCAADPDGDGRGVGPGCAGTDCTEEDATCWEGACCDAIAPHCYVDQTLAADITDGSYSAAARDDSGSDGNAYRTIQDAVNGCNVGDVIYMRGGTYSEIAIDIPESKNGTAWTVGSYTTLRSYPGEWAVVDGTGLGLDAPWERQSVFTHPWGYGTGEERYYTRYWTFSNFEVTGGRIGFFLKLDHARFRYMYIHDNGRMSGDTLIGGILSVCPQYTDIKYCYFRDNEQPVPDGNNSNILFDSDYFDGPGNGEPFNPNAATHHNEIAYNYFEGSRISLRHKNQQRFGFNDRDPNDMTYSEYGDRWHHNVILGAHEAIGASQDFVQIYNNITDSTINIGRAGDVPVIYNAVVYNNTVRRNGMDSSHGSFVTASGYEAGFSNFYDAGDTRTVHEHVWFLNNISDGNTAEYHDTPFILHWDMPQNTLEPGQDNVDIVVSMNLVHDNGNEDTFLVGHNWDAAYTGCDQQYLPMEQFNFCSAAWRGVSAVLNWESTAAGLFDGTAGADRYVAQATFVVDGVATTADAGIGGSHPYLSGVTLPSYVGAATSSDRAWVDGVYDNVTDLSWLRDQVAAPGWGEP